MLFSSGASLRCLASRNGIHVTMLPCRRRLNRREIETQGRWTQCARPRSAQASESTGRKDSTGRRLRLDAGRKTSELIVDEVVKKIDQARVTALSAKGTAGTLTVREMT
jgi:hypothetical protein